jgi:hypothetical protein
MDPRSVRKADRLDFGNLNHTSTIPKELTKGLAANKDEAFRVSRPPAALSLSIV